MIIELLRELFMLEEGEKLSKAIFQGVIGAVLFFALIWFVCILDIAMRG